MEKEQDRNNLPKFLNSSLKYGKNPDNHQNYVGVPWRLLDPSTKVINSNEGV